MSPEAARLAKLHVPERARPGDMWHDERMGTVWLFLGHHKRGRRLGEGHTHIPLYHFGGACLRARNHDLRDNDPNACFLDPHHPPGRDQEPYRYLGNLFEMLPYRALTGHDYKSAFKP